MSEFLGITREPVFSPGRVGDDSAILEAVAACLRQRGYPVAVCSADDEDWPAPADGTVVFAMCQGDRALAQLQRWQARGLRIINTPQGILNCRRHRTVAAFEGTQISFPDSILLETSDQPIWPAWMSNGSAWVKRGDVHATDIDDVVRVDSVTAARDALARFRARGIRRAVVQRHVPGTVLKFYAVRGRFFHCVRPRNGDEIPTHVLRRIDALGQEAARVLHLEIYGGDCVVGVHDRLRLIDLNDWPSYAPCRAEAAEGIAAYLLAHEGSTGT